MWVSTRTRATRRFQSAAKMSGPPSVVIEHRKWAVIIYVFLILGYLSYCCMTVINAFTKLDEPAATRCDPSRATRNVPTVPSSTTPVIFVFRTLL